MMDCLCHWFCGCCTVTQEWMEIMSRTGPGRTGNEKICAAADFLKWQNYNEELFRLVETTF